MKKINIIAISTLVLLMFSVTSCQKKWLDPSFNKDPNAVTDVPGYVLLPSIEAQMAYIFGGMDVTGTTAMWVQYATGQARQASAINGYIYKDSDVENLWGSFYTQGGMMSTKVLMDKSTNPETFSPVYGGISKVLMALWLGNATDLWGDIPYSDAFKGNANLQPKYDSQQQVYDSIQSLLSSAIKLLQIPATGFDVNLGTSDYIYGGNTDAWIKAAWALKARYALHLSKKNANWYTDVINILENQNVMTSNADNMAFYFGTGPTEQNPMYQYEDQRGDMVNNNGFFSMLANDNNDPRSLIYQALPDGASYLAGLYYGQKDSPVEFMTYSELMFIGAEAYYQAGQYDKAKDYLVNGITASINKYKGLDANYDAVADAWLAAKVATYQGTASSPSLEEILTQKYVAEYFHPEAWVDYRRTGIPNLTPVNGRGIPDRFPYPTSEVLYNSNTPKTTLYTPMWWQGQ
jgi:hypothetical protein